MRDGAIPEPAPSFKKNSQTRLLKLNPVPLGAGRVPKKTHPIAIPNCQDSFPMVSVRVYVMNIGYSAYGES